MRKRSKLLASGAVEQEKQQTRPAGTATATFPERIKEEERAARRGTRSSEKEGRTDSRILEQGEQAAPNRLGAETTRNGLEHVRAVKNRIRARQGVSALQQTARKRPQLLRKRSEQLEGE